MLWAPWPSSFCSNAHGKHCWPWGGGRLLGAADLGSMKLPAPFFHFWPGSRLCIIISSYTLACSHTIFAAAVSPAAVPPHPVTQSALYLAERKPPPTHSDFPREAEGCCGAEPPQLCRENRRRGARGCARCEALPGPVRRAGGRRGALLVAAGTGRGLAAAAAAVVQDLQVQQLLRVGEGRVVQGAGRRQPGARPVLGRDVVQPAEAPVAAGRGRAVTAAPGPAVPPHHPGDRTAGAERAFPPKRHEQQAGQLPGPQPCSLAPNTIWPQRRWPREQSPRCVAKHPWEGQQGQHSRRPASALPNELLWRCWGQACCPPPTAPHLFGGPSPHHVLCSAFAASAASRSLRQKPAVSAQPHPSPCSQSQPNHPLTLGGLRCPQARGWSCCPAPPQQPRGASAPQQESQSPLAPRGPHLLRVWSALASSSSALNRRMTIPATTAPSRTMLNRTPTAMPSRLCCVTR